MPEAITADTLESMFGNRRLMQQLAFILEVEKLKTVLRKTPLLDRSRVENDAEHTWQLALMAMVLSEHARQPVDLLRGTAVEGTDGAVVAALPHSDNPEEIYQSSYQFILSGDYKTAEAGFRQYLTMFPDGSHAPDANFWLGEAMLGQDRYREAAEVFLNANRQYPEASKAPEMLLKLGVSLAAMNQRDVACATYTEIGHRYPNVSSALKERVKQEQALAGC